MVLFLSFAIATAANIAPAIRLGQRAPYAGGGWGLLISPNTDCAAGTTKEDAGVAFGAGQYLCCPDGFAPQGGGGINGITCCSNGSSCLDALQAEPFCADSSWVLWNATSQDVGSGYFCCLENQLGTQDMACDSGSSNIPASLAAQMIGQPVPTGAAGETLKVTAAASSTISGTSTTTASSASTSATKDSAGGIISSVISKATMKSDSSRNMPTGGSDIFRSITLFAGCGIAGFAGMIAVIIGVF